jgi:hypothetical protein
MKIDGRDILECGDKSPLLDEAIPQARDLDQKRGRGPGDFERVYERHLSPSLSPILQMAERVPRAGLRLDNSGAGRRPHACRPN